MGEKIMAGKKSSCIFVLLLVALTVAYFYLKAQKLHTDSYNNATQMYVKAAEKGDDIAMLSLATSYYHGKGGVEQDFQMAMKWYLKAAELGNADAMDNIGALYEEGEGVEIDYVKALTWYKKAAERGSEQAAFYAGKMYYEGLGVTKDLIVARQYFLQAARAGYANANERLNEIYSATIENNLKLATLNWYN